MGEGFGEWGGFAEFVASDRGEDEPVVPVATGLLDGLEGAGQLAGRACRFWRVLGEVAGQLCGLADRMEVFRVVGIGLWVRRACSG